MFAWTGSLAYIKISAERGSKIPGGSSSRQFTLRSLNGNSEWKVDRCQGHIHMIWLPY